MEKRKDETNTGAKLLDTRIFPPGPQGGNFGSGQAIFGCFCRTANNRRGIAKTLSNSTSDVK